MARLFTSGFEANDLTVEGLDAGVTTFEVDNVRTGTYSGNAARFLISGGALARTYYARGYFRVASLTSTDFLLYFEDGTGTRAASKLTTGGKVQLGFGAFTQIGSDSIVTVTVGQWYRLELSYQVNAGSGDDHAELYLDGVLVASTTTATIGTTVPLDVVWYGQGGTNGIRWDDLAINDDQGANQNSYPGDGKVVLLVPISDNARSTLWTGGVGGTTNLFDAVNNKPPIGTATETDLTQIEHAGNAAGTQDQYLANMTTYNSAGINGTAVACDSASAGTAGVGEVASDTRQAQSFKANGNFLVLRLPLGKTGSPVDNLEIALQADSAGSPSGTDLTSVAISGATLTTTTTWMDTGIPPIALTSGTNYWIVLRRSGALDAANAYKVGVASNASGGTPADTYQDGAFKTYTGAAWGAASADTDMCFSISLGADDVINVVQPVYAHGEDITTGTKVVRGELLSNPTSVSGTQVNAGNNGGALGTYPATWAIQREAMIYNPRVAYGNSPLMRIVRPETASRVASVCFMGIVVDYTPTFVDWEILGRPYGQSGQRQMQQLLAT